jgi:ATP-dependent DNA ligase
MADIKIMKAVEFDKLPVKFKKTAVSEFHLYVNAGYLLQKKYDGCFGMAELWPKHLGTSRMLSREGKDWSPSCQHILRELEEALDEYNSGDNWQPCFVLGEVWHPDWKFPKISGTYRRGAASGLCFIANDFIPSNMETDDPYHVRLLNLRELLPQMGNLVLGSSYYVDVAETHSFLKAGPEDPIAASQQWVAEGGFDGAILRNPAAGYTIGTVKQGEIIKVKPTMSLDLRCNGVIQGEGKHLGRLGAISVGYKGVTTCVGTGFTDDERDAFWYAATSTMSEGHPSNPINKIVEVEFMGFTEDGRLREPRFKGIRFDKEQPDT